MSTLAPHFDFEEEKKDHLPLAHSECCLLAALCRRAVHCQHDVILRFLRHAPRQFHLLLAVPSTCSKLICYSKVLIIAHDCDGRCGVKGSCGPSGKLDYAYAVLGIVLNNAAASQSLFYQVWLVLCGYQNAIRDILASKFSLAYK